jgi:GT2 family glycosyltransferase
MASKVSIIIASVNRSDQLEQTVESILQQSYLPCEIIISIPDATHVTAKTTEMAGVKVLLGPRGSCHQRNTALDNVSPDSRYVFFFDDDMELCRSYIEATVALMEGHPGVVVVVGEMILDAANRKWVSREEAIQLCQAGQKALDESRRQGAEFSVRKYGQTCNMAVRWSTAQAERFDENLPLYGWMEDLDYSHRLRRYGQVVICHNSLAVHLGWRGGRMSGKKMGYSQIVNPLYLWRKNRCLSLVTVIYRHWLWQIAANVVGSVLRDQDVDRPGRLIGNIVAVKDLMLGRAHPTLILSGRL